MKLPTKTTTIAIALVALFLGAGIAAAAVTITQNDPNPIAPGQGTVKGSQDLSIASQSLTYSGVNATGVTVDVNNTATSDHTADVHISVKKADGTIVESTTFTGKTLTASSVTSVSFTFTKERPVDTFADIEVVVEQTA